jgi:hypothetical protein
LPEWARAIFSKDMVAASNINTITELDAFLKLAHDSLSCYLTNVNYSSSEDLYIDQQNFYCKMQKQNPHTPRVLESLGFEKELVVNFINTGLFPEIGMSFLDDLKDSVEEVVEVLVPIVPHSIVEDVVDVTVDTIVEVVS